MDSRSGQRDADEGPEGPQLLHPGQPGRRAADPWSVPARRPRCATSPTAWRGPATPSTARSWPATAAPRTTSRVDPGRTGTPAPRRPCSSCARTATRSSSAGCRPAPLLALLLAARNPKDVQGTALLAPTFWLNGWLIPWYARLFRAVTTKRLRQPDRLPRHRAARHQGRPRARLRPRRPVQRRQLGGGPARARRAGPSSSTAGWSRGPATRSRTSTSRP